MAGAQYPPKWKTPFMPAGAAALNSFAAQFAKRRVLAPKRRKVIQSKRHTKRYFRHPEVRA